MRGTVSQCHVALSKDTWLLIWVRPFGPSLTTFNRRSCSKMARADTICSQGRGEWVSAWAMVHHSTVVGRISLVASYVKGHRQRHVWCLARVLALHALPVCAYSAPACVYLALVCAFASQFALVDTTCLRARVLCLCGTYMLASSAYICVCAACASACAVYCLGLTFSIAVSSEFHSHSDHF